MGLSLPLTLLAALLVSCAAPQLRGPAEETWEPARLERMRVAVKQAGERGDIAEAERLCVVALRYVSASTVRSLDEYSLLLAKLNRPEAEAARARTDKLREATFRPGPGSVYLGFAPSHEVRAYASLLRELGHTADAEAMMALADAKDREQQIHFIRLQMLNQGRDPRGTC